MTKARLKAAAKRIHAAAAAYPGATLDHPWGENVYKVGGKVFVFFGVPAEHFLLVVKLPQSAGAALMLPFTEPAGYGLGKAGWISAKFEAEDEVPEGLIIEWIEESYRAVAKKKLLQLLDAGAGVKAPQKKKPAKAKRKS